MLSLADGHITRMEPNRVDVSSKYTLLRTFIDPHQLIIQTLFHLVQTDTVHTSSL